MKRDHAQARAMSLKDVLDGATRATQRVAQWPEWKQKLSHSRTATVEAQRIKHARTADRESET